MADVKRKTFTSTAVKKRYNDKTYQSYTIRFRFDSDEKYINYFSALLSQGFSPSEIVKKLIDELN